MKSKQEIHIRLAKPSDTSSLMRLIQDLAAYEKQPVPTIQSSELQTLLAKDEYRFLVAHNKDTTVGFAFAYAGYDLASGSKGLHLGDIFVSESHRNQGVGKRLIAELAKMNEHSGGEWISFTVLEDNSNAKTFYQHLGSQKIKVDFMAIGKSKLKEMRQRA